MGYRIDYDGNSGSYEVIKDTPWRLPVMTGICFLIFMLLCGWFWPEGADLMQDILVPGDNAQTLEALNTLSIDLKAGASVEEAVTAFCREIIRSAESQG